MHQRYIFYAYVITLLVMSLLSFVSFFVDKRRAMRGEDRIQEKTLLLLTVFGGAAGSLLGRRIACHKTNKFYFSLIIIFSLCSEILTFLLLFFFLFQNSAL